MVKIRRSLCPLWGCGLHQTSRQRRTCHARQWEFYLVVHWHGCHQTQAPPCNDWLMSWLVNCAKLVRQLDRVASSIGGVGQAIRVHSPHALEGHGAVCCVGNRMALMPQRAWVRVPSTRLSGQVDPHIEVGPLMPEEPERQPMASCSSAGGGGRLFPATLESELTGEMVKVPVRMPAQSGASMPSHDGREGIRTSVSHHSEANCRIASLLYFSYYRKGNNTSKPSTVQAR
jgi:hypothetical protein